MPSCRVPSHESLGEGLEPRAAGRGLKEIKGASSEERVGPVWWVSFEVVLGSQLLFFSSGWFHSRFTVLFLVCCFGLNALDVAGVGVS